MWVNVRKTREIRHVLKISGISMSEQSSDGPLWLLVFLCLFPDRAVHAAAPWRV